MGCRSTSFNKNCGHHTCMHQRRSSRPSQNNLSPKPQVTPKTATTNNQLHPITLAWLRVTKRLIKLRKSQTQAQIVSTYAQVSIVLNAAGPTRYPLKPTEQDPQIVWWFNLSLSLSPSYIYMYVYHFDVILIYPICCSSKSIWRPQQQCSYCVITANQIFHHLFLHHHLQLLFGPNSQQWSGFQ